jgi:UDPglucose--hexose-1-phosphate uridylyltransferase
MELRQDPTTRAWILSGKESEKEEVKDTRCPFCRGNEDLTPKTIRALYNQKGEWIVRSFPDKSPIFQIEGNLDRQADGMFDKMRNIGAHEVIIEAPGHTTSLTSLSENVIADVLKMYRERVSDLKKDRRFKYILVFKNHGSLAGSLIEHIHSHIIGTPVIPARLERELRWAKSHYDMKGRCLFCDIIYQESKQKMRIVFENKDFISFCPFASRFSYEVWTLPLIHNHSFENNLEKETVIDSLAQILKVILLKIERITTSYHVVFHISPNEYSFRTIRGDIGTIVDDFHWHIEILPRTERESRLQREEEFYINTVLPEDAAKMLREMK